MRHWLVAAGLVEGPGGLLLVRNRRHDGSEDWTPPGGVVEDGEATLDGLGREVLEETGIRVDDWEGPVYEVEAHASDMGWVLRVEVHRARSWSGDLRVADPDGIVVDACFVEHARVGEHLAGAPRWVVEPLGSWLAQRWERPRRFGYDVAGTRRAEIRVTPRPC